MPKSDHPAAKAGRFVRAVGLTVQSEVEKRTAAIAAAEQAKKATPPPPPPAAVPTNDLAGKAAFGLFVAAAVAMTLVAMHLELVLKGTPGTVFRLIAAVIMGTEGAVLVSNWGRGNQRLVQRVLNRMFGMARGPMNRREKTFARIIKEGLTLFGIAFLAAATFEIITAFVGE